MGNVKDLEGVRFGTWTATNTMERINGRLSRLCICDCGAEHYVITSNLTSGKSKGCDSCKKEKQKTQGGDSLPSSEYYGLYTSHSSMMARCYYDVDKSFKSYGGNGVTVCEEWHDYNTFKAWALLNGWSKGLVIGRNGDIGNYEPSNVKWITRSENSKESGKRSRYNSRSLTEDQIRFIRSLDVKPGKHNTIDLHGIAEDLGISYAHLQGIRNYQSYKDIK